MLEPQRMDRVLIVGTKDVMEPAIAKLHELNMLHVEDYVEEGEYFHIGKPLKNATPLSEKLLKLRAIKSYLGTKETAPVKESQEKVQKELEANLGSLEQTVTGKTSEKSSLESDIKELDRRSELLKPYEALGINPGLLTGYENFTVFMGTVTADIEPTIKGITENYELFSAPYGKDSIIALVVPKDVAHKVSEALNKSSFVETEQLREKGEPSAIRKSIEDARAKADADLKKVVGELAELNKKYAQLILSSEELLTIDTQKAEAPLKFATSENTFVAEGWVPTPDFEKFKSSLENATNGSVYVTKIDPIVQKYKGEVDATVDKHIEHHEIDAPVKYKNPKILGPMEMLIDMYGRPRYDEVDPTILFSILFPVFYGFILGDVGYGLLALGAALVVKRMTKNSEGWQKLLAIFIACAISAIIFGFIFGEFFGFQLAQPTTYVSEKTGELMHNGGVLGVFSLSQFYPHDIHIGNFIGPFNLPFERLEAGGPNHEGTYVFGIKDLLVFTCIVGIVHIMIGYAIGFRNELKQHGLITAILHKGSWASMLMGGTAVVLYVFPLAMAQALGTLNVMNPLFLGGAILFVLGFILMLLGEGPMGVVEITNPLSHTLSYTRLLAVGLSSVGIAFAINTIAGMLAAMGIIGIIAAVVVFLLGHTVNLVLGIYAPFIQSLRLHYVEFFQKFYKSGGRIYDPFGYNRKYTED